MDHDDIDDEISYMATNAALLNHDPHAEPLLDQPGIARNIDSPQDDIPPEDLQELLDEDAAMDQPPSDSEREEPALAPQRAPVRYSSIIYMINSPAIQAQMSYGDRNEFYAQAATLVQIPLNQLVYLYKIPYPPEDLDQSRTIPMIAQIAGELTPGSIHRYILLDIEFHATLPSLTPETDRSARLLPKQLTRFQILRICGLANYCLRAMTAQSGCLVWINGRLIHEQDRSLYDLSHGDYVRVAVPPDLPTAEAFSTREMTAICWVGAAPIAEMGEAGREHLPDYLPMVPPDTSTVYALPPVHMEAEEESFMQTSSASTSTRDRPTSAAPSCEPAAHAHTPLHGPSNSTTTPDIHEMPQFEQRLHHLRSGRRETRTSPAHQVDVVTTWYIDHHRVPPAHANLAFGRFLNTQPLKLKPLGVCSQGEKPLGVTFLK